MNFGWNTLFKTAMAFFGWRQSASDRRTIIDEEARDIADMAHAKKEVSDSNVKVLKGEIKAINLTDKKRHVEGAKKHKLGGLFGGWRKHRRKERKGKLPE